MPAFSRPPAEHRGRTWHGFYTYNSSCCITVLLHPFFFATEAGRGVGLRVGLRVGYDARQT